MSDEPTHPGDALIATALLLGAEFTGDEVSGFWCRSDGATIGNFYSKRAIAAAWLIRKGYRISPTDGSVTLRGM